MRPGARGARAGGEGPSAAAAPAGLQLTRGHGGAGQAGVAGRCHLRARRAPPRAQPRSRRSRRGPQPMAKSRGRAAGTSLWTLPALPAPPDDALPPPLFMCGFRPPGRLRTLLSASLRASGVGASGGGRGAAGAQRSRLRPSPPAASAPTRAAGPWRPAGSPHPPLGARLPNGTSSGPGEGGGRQTDRATSPFSLRPNSARAHTKEGEETRELGGWFGCRGLDSSRSGGWRGRPRAARRSGRGPRWTEQRGREVPGRPPGGAGLARLRCAAPPRGCEGDRERGGWRGSLRPARLGSSETARLGSRGRRRGH